LIAMVYAPLLIVWFGFRRRIGSFGFYLVFAVAVTTSVQVVGVYLVFASLIFPALGVWFLPPERRLPAAYGLALGGILLGLATSVITDYPTGPVLVWSLALTAVFGALLLARWGAKKASK
ncbi:MAG: metal ABC transporter permease, partial [Sphingomonadales bacterium]